VVPLAKKKLFSFPIHPPMFPLEEEVYEFSYSNSCRWHYAKIRKVAGSILNEVIGFFC
jgi:hypothetical protein